MWPRFQQIFVIVNVVFLPLPPLDLVIPLITAILVPDSLEGIVIVVLALYIAPVTLEPVIGKL